MKKTLVSALTTALVVGAASTTFAAANPFSDVPADHWAYDAVSQLAADGVIEGYGDTTFRGNQNITRYEMAQMIAKAMAKTDVSAADKALIDKLAAEFSDELNNLGVRVSNLERNADMVKWNGKAEYTYTSNRNKDEHTKANDDQLLFRLEPTAEVNSNWHVKARLDATTDLATDSSDALGKHGNSQDTDVTLKRIWAQGDYNKFQVKLGKFAPIDDDSIFDTNFSGAQVAFGNKVTFTAGAGRLSGLDDLKTVRKDLTTDSAANYQYAGLGYADGKFVGGVDYHHLNADSFDYVVDRNATKGNVEDNANIWLAKAAYRFDKTNALNGFYANNTSADDFDKAWSAEYDYKGAQAENKGTWGAWAAYRYLGDNTALFSTYDALLAGQKGWEVGANYAPFKNVVATLRYGNGKDLWNDTKIENLFGRIEMFF
ncbi:S-layer homology domain-containing protein [Mitsuokella sp. UBA4253]|uniref:S-layer homology domain-containing protein n=1 Tax=Mitsuokella sp. UBA4253 TaxID=1946959 RepID=UPI00257E01A8|nr:S-layer homology domain-containing protein [Mitsuokella sp. UBA4253]MDO5583254.1 S-layer homology domain-containing protein [Mitsuokella multacida]